MFAILVFAVIIRILYLVEVHNDVLLHITVRYDVFDECHFIKLAAQIIHGNWFGLTTGYNICYPYLISLLYLFLPKDITTIFIFQIILGVIAVYVSYKTAVLLFDNKIAGLIAAFIVALYSPFIFNECDIERGAVIAYSNLFCFYLLLKAFKTDKLKYFFYSGLMMGFSLVIRPNILPVFVAPYIFFAVKRSSKAKICSVSAFLLGVVILAAPFAFRNMILGQGFNIEPQGLKSFWDGNAHDSPGIGYAVLKSESELTKESGNDIGKAFVILSREIKKYPEEYMGLYSRKIKMFLCGYEVPSNLNYYLFKERYAVLNAGFFNFAIVCPLALTGIFLARRNIHFIGLFYIFLFVLSFSNILFHIQGRYRLPAVPFFIIMASYTICWLSDRARKREWLLAGCAILAIVGTAFYTRPDYHLIKKYSGGVIRAIDYRNLSHAYFQKSTECGIDNERKDYFLKESEIYLKKANDVAL
ncbi:MAG: glycosyltransferase family 39 protein [Candidatus Omnitrophica bacterium]|nr:glycosyltransferase family 39 protein [Candidatus Omnitrophota bacterium]